MENVNNTPQDAQVIASILNDMGVMEYEPRVLNKLLEFSYHYMSNVLEDAQVYSECARKSTIDDDDVGIAIQIQVDKHFSPPVSKEVLLEAARQTNSIPLPPIKQTAGLQIPTDRYSLIACNYRYKYKIKESNTSPREDDSGTAKSTSVSHSPRKDIGKLSVPAKLTKRSANSTEKTAIHTPATDSCRILSMPILDGLEDTFPKFSGHHGNKRKREDES